MVNEAMKLSEKQMHKYFMHATVDEVMKQPRLVNDTKLEDDVQAAYLAGYHNGGLDLYKSFFGAMKDGVEQAKTEGKKTGKKLGKFIVFTALVSAAVYLYNKHEEKQAAIKLDDTDDDFFEDDDE